MKDFDFENLKTTGIRVNYLVVCERKLWLFDRGITMEHGFDAVLMGKLVGEDSYRREPKRELLIDNLISIDIMGTDKIGEVKLSNRLKAADRLQILYYLYYLRQLGVEKKGIINYPAMRRKEEVLLTTEACKKVEKALVRIKEVLSKKRPPEVKRKPYCPKCAYFELCWS